MTSQLANHLELKSVSKRFGGVVAVDNVSFAVPRRGFWGLMGANGAGKTTLFSMIAGTHAPSSGDVLLDGESIAQLGPAASCRRGVARTFQIVRPFQDMTVLETACVAAMYGRHRRGFEAAREYAHESIVAAGLGALADRAAGGLTLSNQKRLELARALATGGELLLLDEIMAGLTPTEVGEMLELLRRVHADWGLTIVCIEHVMRALMDLADQIVVLHHGVKIAEGCPQDIAHHEDVVRHYFGEA